MTRDYSSQSTNYNHSVTIVAGFANIAATKVDFDFECRERAATCDASSSDFAALRWCACAGSACSSFCSASKFVGPPLRFCCHLSRENCWYSLPASTNTACYCSLGSFGSCIVGWAPVAVPHH